MPLRDVLLLLANEGIVSLLLVMVVSGVCFYYNGCIILTSLVGSKE